jgi:hypothetical protein
MDCPYLETVSVELEAELFHEKCIIRDFHIELSHLYSYIHGSSEEEKVLLSVWNLS